MMKGKQYLLSTIEKTHKTISLVLESFWCVSKGFTMSYFKRLNYKNKQSDSCFEKLDNLMRFIASKQRNIPRALASRLISQTFNLQY